MTKVLLESLYARYNHRAFVPPDPVKYDFALSRIGILEDCTGRPRPACASCELRGLCRRPARSSGTSTTA